MNVNVNRDDFTFKEMNNAMNLAKTNGVKSLLINIVFDLLEVK